MLKKLLMALNLMLLTVCISNANAQDLLKPVKGDFPFNIEKLVKVSHQDAWKENKHIKFYFENSGGNILSPVEGVVVNVEFTYYYHQGVYIKDNNGFIWHVWGLDGYCSYSSCESHLKVGQKLAKGEVIGEVADYSYSYGRGRVDLSISKDEVSVDPTLYLPLL